MSASLLKKSLKLFEQEETGKSTGNKGGKVQKRSKKNKPVKSALETYLEKNPKKDKTQENLELLGRIKKEAFTQASADKIFKYHLKRNRKIKETETVEKSKGSAFTEEDFRKFEEEYFVKV